MAVFRGQLEENNYNLDEWIERELGGSILDEKVLSGLDILGKDLVKLLKNMLLKDPSERVSAVDALRFLNSIGNSESSADDDDILGGGCDVVFDDADEDEGEGDLEIVVSLNTKTDEPLGLILSEEVISERASGSNTP